MSKQTIGSGDKALLAHLAHGTCFNPECDQPLFVNRSGTWIINYVIAHIRDEQPPCDITSNIGWRYHDGPVMTLDERNSYSNLILLCTPCHKLIDSIRPCDYPSTLLHEWKTHSEGQGFHNGLVPNLHINNLEEELRIAFDSIVAIERVTKDCLSEIEKVSRMVSGGQSFPLAEYPSFDPAYISKVSVAFTAVGGEVLHNVGIDFCIEHFDEAQSKSYFLEWQGITIPALHPGRKLSLFSSDYSSMKSVSFWPLVSKARLRFEYWTNTGRFIQLTKFEYDDCYGINNVYPRLNEVWRAEAGVPRELLYRHEYSLRSGVMYSTINPIVGSNYIEIT